VTLDGMHVTLNGGSTDLVDGTSLAELAVAHNGEVIPRGGWPELVLREGDRVDVLTAVQGG